MKSKLQQIYLSTKLFDSFIQRAQKIHLPTDNL